MKSLAILLSLPCLVLAEAPKTAAPVYPRPLMELNTSYFPFHGEGLALPEGFEQRKQATRERILLACGLLPLPTKTPLNPVIHGRVERDDYTIDRVFFESFPGFYVTGSLYLPKTQPKNGKMPGVLCPHGHWPNGRFMDIGVDTPEANKQFATGAERFDSGARNPLQARCAQLARMGCAAFLYDMIGYADSVQIPEHRSGRREALNGNEPGTYGLYAMAAEHRLESNFGLQTWNGLRALDFILTLPGIDPARIAVTGASGGGTQTLILSALDDRVTAAFPCVMTSTAMQGGCTCENACYLRIGQGNIDLAAASAPRPFGMTAADDWTKELQTKGWPDLQMVWKKLGKPDNIEARFNTHFPHNYNHVSRTQMYDFINRHFKLGLKSPVLERDFKFAPQEETTVWTAEHPMPSDASIEAKTLKHWSDDSDVLIKAKPEVIAKAWDIIIARPMPAGSDISFEIGDKDDSGSYVVVRGTTHYAKENEEVAITVFAPKSDWNGNTILWLTSKALTEPDAATKKLLDAGCAVVVPQLYLSTADKAPWNPVKTKAKTEGAADPFLSACFTYGYNHPLVVQRVHDAMSAVVTIKNYKVKPKKLIIAASEGMSAVGALAAACMKDLIDGSVIDTQGFRFASLTDVQDVNFVPGAVKYGDLPALLELCDKAKTTVLGEAGAAGGAETVADAVLKAVK